MQWTKTHAQGVKDKIFLHVINGSTTLLNYGEVCVWDETVNDAVAGILRNTRGERVIGSPTNTLTNRSLTKAGVVFTADTDGGGPLSPANTDTAQVFLLQVWGHHRAVKVTGDTTQFRGCIISNTALSGITSAAIALTAAELTGCIGWFYTTATAPGTAEVHIMGIL